MTGPGRDSGADDLIDLHAHTNESDGSLSPGELVALAGKQGLSALAITDHDTFAGYLKAREHSGDSGLDLVCGIELNARMGRKPEHGRRSVHLLAYFLAGEPPPAFTKWLENEREERRERNARLAQKLRDGGIDITLEEVEARGKTLAGRPHFARILLDKNYVGSFEEAFARYLGERAPTYTPRQSKTATDVIEAVRSAGGVPTVAHPIRLGLARDEERELLLAYRAAGLIGLEVYHSEQMAELQAFYLELARELGLMPTGGSDFHGAIKPDIELGRGLNGNVRVPLHFLEDLRTAARNGCS